MEFSENILSYFQEHNIVPAQISAQIGVHKSTFTKWKNNPTSKIDLDIAFKISKYLNVSIECLITGQECNSFVTKDEKDFLEKFNRLETIDKVKILERMEVLLENRSGETAHPGNGSVEVNSGVAKPTAAIHEEKKHLA